MGRTRVSKGQIIMRKEEKLTKVAKVMELKFGNGDFVAMFQYMYPKDWMNIEKRYKEHLEVNRNREAIPMPEPTKYLLMVSKKYIEEIRLEHDQGILLTDEQRSEIKEMERIKSLAKMQSTEKTED
jgi:hypothetical protein